MNHETQRLLFAASRGAQVQTMYGSGGVWRNTGVLFTLSPELHRIHPEDAHLQYGPIATELRKMAMDDCYCSLPPIGTMAINWLAFVDFLSLQLTDETDDDVFSWLCLFAAELAADEGM